MIKKHIAILLLAAGMFASCNTSTSTTSNNPSYIPANPSTMIFTVNGSTTDTLTTTSDDTTVYGIKGTGIIGAGVSTSTKTALGLGIVLGNVTSTGTYNIGALTTSNPLTDIYLYYTYVDTLGNNLRYASPETPSPLPSNAVGSITIDTLTSTSVVGTFNGTLTLQSGNGAQTVTITNGGFRATIL